MDDVKSDFSKDVDRHIKSNEKVVEAIDTQTEIIKETSSEATSVEKVTMDLGSKILAGQEKAAAINAAKVQEQTDAITDPLQVTAKSAAETADKTDPPSVKAEKTADKKRDQQTLVDLLGGIGDGVNKLFDNAKNFIKDQSMVSQGVFAGLGLYALSEFLQSDFALDMMTTVISSLTALFGDIEELSKDFTVGGLIDVVKDNFLTLIGILTALAPKSMFNLAKKAIMGTAGFFDKSIEFYKDGGIKKSFANIGTQFESFKDGLKSFGKNIKNGLEFVRKGGLDEMIKKTYTSMATSMGGAFKYIRVMTKLMFRKLRILKKMIATKGFFPMLNSIWLSALKSVALLAKGLTSMIIAPIKFLATAIVANPIAAAILAVVGIFTYIAGKLGFLDPIIDALKNAWNAFTGGLVSLYNSVASFLGFDTISDDPATTTTPTNFNATNLEMADNEMAELAEENALNRTAAGMNTSDGEATNVVTTNNTSSSVTNNTQSDVSIVDTDRLFRHLTNMTI